MLMIEFEIEHQLYKGARVEILMPDGLALPANGTVIEVLPLGFSTRATQATVVDRTIVIENDFVPVDEREEGFLFKFGLSDIQNQISAKDAGSYQVSTYYWVERT